jgi:hypothetical protein
LREGREVGKQREKGRKRKEGDHDLSSTQECPQEESVVNYPLKIINHRDDSQGKGSEEEERERVGKGRTEEGRKEKR